MTPASQDSGLTMASANNVTHDAQLATPKELENVMKPNTVQLDTLWMLMTIARDVMADAVCALSMDLGNVMGVNSAMLILSLNQSPKHVKPALITVTHATGIRLCQEQNAETMDATQLMVLSLLTRLAEPVQEIALDATKTQREQWCVQLVLQIFSSTLPNVELVQDIARSVLWSTTTSFNARSAEGTPFSEMACVKSAQTTAAVVNTRETAWSATLAPLPNMDSPRTNYARDAVN